MGMLYPIEGRPANPLGKFYRADHRCSYHSGAVGHDTENCSTLKHKIQNMINNNLINIEETTWMKDILDAQEWVQDISELNHLEIIIREEECLTLAKILHIMFCYLSLESVSHISCLNYVRPDFSRMRYVGGLCRPRSFHYQNFLFWLILERGTTFDLIPAPTGYVGATTARS